MGTFYVNCTIESTVSPKKSVTIHKMLVDTGAEYSWIPEMELERVGIQPRKKDVAFIMANGTRITRDVGYAILRVGEFETVDEVVFGREGDMKLLGARTMEGFAAVIDPRQKRLVAAGPLPVGSIMKRTPWESDPI